MLLLLAAHAVAALCAPLLVRALGRRAFWLLSLPPLATAGWALASTSAAFGDRPPTAVTEWVPALGMTLAFRLDPLAWLLCLVVGGVGALVLAYCSGYFEDDEPGLGRFAAYLVAFAGAMLGLVTSDDLLVLYIFWEATTVLSFLLIGHYVTSRTSRGAASQALVVTTAGGLAMLGGVILLGESADSYRVSEVLTHDWGGTGSWYLGTAVVLLLVGALSKSALFPFHFWLPGAMAAPTPVSAYLHAAAMVKAGIYLVARFAPAFAQLPAWRWTVLVAGGFTMLLGAYRALRQHDLKLLLAYGTVSQLGFLVVLVGTGTEQAALAGLTMLLAHALYKGCLFLCVGTIDHTVGTRDLRELNGVRSQLPGVVVAATLAAASMAGLPPLLGFVGKEAVYSAYAGSGLAAALYVLVVLVVGSMLTVAYSARFVLALMVDDGSRPRCSAHRAPLVTVVAPLLLALLGLVAGPLSPLLEDRLAAAGGVLPHDTTETHLGLWHGVNAALLLSLLTLGVGAVLVLLRLRVNKAQARIGGMTGESGVDDLYRSGMAGLDRWSLRITAALNRGSLPLSLGLVLTTFVVLTTWALVSAGTGPGRLTLSHNVGQAAVGLITVVAAVWAVRARRRLRAVLLVGVTGYGTAAIFLFQGAPDLALTQVLAETVSLVVFVLVLRTLPSRFDGDHKVTRRLRFVIGGACGLVVTALALVIPQARQHPAASTGFAEYAKEFGGGKNIVNVALVDIRAWDTMGELSVVVAAATGIASLVFLRLDPLDRVQNALHEARRRRASYARMDPSHGHWLPETSGLQHERRSLQLEVVTRLVFHAVLVWSLYLLFAGHNNPGGGFAAGIVAGMAIALRYLAGGVDELRATAPFPPGLLLGTGLFLSAGNALLSMAVGGEALQTWDFDLHLPLVGDLHVVTSLLFDVGVYLAVVGLMLDVLRSLGAGIDREAGGGDLVRQQELRR